MKKVSQTLDRSTRRLPSHLEWFAPAAAVVLFRRPAVVVLLAVHGRFVRTARFVWQVQRAQLGLVILEELLQGSDFDVVLAAHNRYFSVWTYSHQKFHFFNTVFADTSAKRENKSSHFKRKLQLGLR